MTVFEKQQLDYKKHEEFGGKAINILKSKSYSLTVRDSVDYEDFSVEFVITDVYTSMGDMMAFDIKINKMDGEYQRNKLSVKEFKKTNSNQYRRVVNSLRESFYRIKSDVVVKSVLYNVNVAHLNNVNI